MIKDMINKSPTLKIEGYGNRLHVICNMISGGKFGIPTKLLNPIAAKMDFKDALYPCGFIIFAEK